MRHSFWLGLLPAFAASASDVDARVAPFLAGGIHPILDPLHLLAVVIVGLLAGTSGGRARWAFPVAYVGGTVLGEAMSQVLDPGMMLVPVVCVAGALLAVALLTPPVLGFGGALLLLGFAHGHSHALELAALGGLPFGAGNLAAMALLVSAGLLLGFALGPQRSTTMRGLAATTFLAGAIVAF